MSSVPELIEVEVDTDGNGRIEWLPAKTFDARPDGSFSAIVNGDGDFIETYTLSEEGVEWRVPSQAQLEELKRAYAKGVDRFELAKGKCSTQAASDASAGKGEEVHKPTSGGDTEAPGRMAVGQILEVEVDDGGTISWKPSRVVELLEGNRFTVCINGESNFLEEYGDEDEGTEWRLVEASRMPAISAAYAAAVAAWTEKVADGKEWIVEKVLGLRRPPKSASGGVEYLCKWQGYTDSETTWEPEATPSG